jgi:hypothetical protein
MTTSPSLRQRNAILSIALAAIILALLGVATISAVQRISASLGLACHRLLPRAPSLPRSMPWRISGCFGRPLAH